MSATLQDKLAKLAQRILKSPAAVGLTLPSTGDQIVHLQEAAFDSFEMPVGLQQLFMDVPWKLRLPALIGMRATLPYHFSWRSLLADGIIVTLFGGDIALVPNCCTELAQGADERR